MQLKPKATRKTTSLCLSPEAMRILHQLKEQYGMSQGLIVEQLLLTGGAKLLKTEK